MKVKIISAIENELEFFYWFIIMIKYHSKAQRSKYWKLINLIISFRNINWGFNRTKKF